MVGFDAIGEANPTSLDELSGAVIGAAIEVHRTIGPGLLESVYSDCLKHELALRGIAFSANQRVLVNYKGARLPSHFRLDLVVDRQLVVELKSVEILAPVHRAQLLTYLTLGNFRRGLLINFNVTMLRNGIVRVVNQDPSASLRRPPRPPVQSVAVAAAVHREGHSGP